MTPSVKRLYKAAIANDQFLKEMVEADKTNKKPNMFSSELFKTMYAVTYFGWLVGKGLYTEGMFD